MRKKQNLDDCELELLSFQASKIPYDITLDIIDDSIEGNCALHLIVRNDLYTEQQADTMVKWIVKLASSFARIPNLTLDAAAMFDAQEMERVHELSIGEWVLIRYISASCSDSFVATRRSLPELHCRDRP